MNRASGICGTITKKSNTCVMKSQKKRRESGAEKTFKKVMTTISQIWQKA